MISTRRVTFCGSEDVRCGRAGQHSSGAFEHLRDLLFEEVALPVRPPLPVRYDRARNRFLGNSQNLLRAFQHIGFHCFLRFTAKGSHSRTASSRRSASAASRAPLCVAAVFSPDPANPAEEPSPIPVPRCCCHFQAGAISMRAAKPRLYCLPAGGRPVVGYRHGPKLGRHRAAVAHPDDFDRTGTGCKTAHASPEQGAVRITGSSRAANLNACRCCSHRYRRRW